MRLLSLLILTFSLGPAVVHAELYSEDGSEFQRALDIDSRVPATLLSVLRRDGTNPPQAIRAILDFFKTRPEWNGETKYEYWNQLVSVYNRSRWDAWINPPSLVTRSGGIVMWGETRGNLLVFTADGRMFKRYDPEQPDPQGGAKYQIPWHTLTEVR